MSGDPSVTAAARRRVAALARQVAGSSDTCSTFIGPSPTAAPSDPPSEPASCPRTAGGPFRPDRLLEGQVREEGEKRLRAALPRAPASSAPPPPPPNL